MTNAKSKLVPDEPRKDSKCPVEAYLYEQDQSWPGTDRMKSPAVSAPGTIGRKFIGGGWGRRESPVDRRLRELIEQDLLAWMRAHAHPDDGIHQDKPLYLRADAKRKTRESKEAPGLHMERRGRMIVFRMPGRGGWDYFETYFFYRGRALVFSGDLLDGRQSSMWKAKSYQVSKADDVMRQTVYSYNHYFATYTEFGEYPACYVAGEDVW